MKTIIGAIAGDIIGSRFEFHNIKTKDFELLSDECFFTDDTVMTCAVAKALMESDKPWGDSLSTNAVKYMRGIGCEYPHSGYGRKFFEWLLEERPSSYQSCGNGAAMRISPAAYMTDSLSKLKDMCETITIVSHNHSEAVKGAEATAFCVWAANNRWTKDMIIDFVKENYYPGLEYFTLDNLRPTYRFYETCQNTVPEAIKAFEEATDYEDAIRNAISIGGDSDTIAAITGGIAGAYYGVPTHIRDWAMDKLDFHLRMLVEDFDNYIYFGRR